MPATISSVTTFGAAAPGHEHGADDEVGVLQLARDLVRRRGERVDAVVVARVDLAQLRQRDVEHGDVGAEAEGRRRGLLAGDAAADDDDLRRGGCRARPPSRMPRPPRRCEQLGRADLGRETAGDLAHGGEQRQRAVGELHRLVGDRGGAGVEDRPGQRQVGREVQVREEREVLAQEAVLGRDRLLHLEHEFGRPGLVGRGDDRRTRRRRTRRRSTRRRRRRRPGCRRGGRARRARATPAGVMATRNSLFLISAGTPMCMMTPKAVWVMNTIFAAYSLTRKPEPLIIR